jgi:hypothetical protein
MAESKFHRFQRKLQAEGYSKSSAQRIAAKKGDEKYGKEEMARRSAASRARHEARRAGAA